MLERAAVIAWRSRWAEVNAETAREAFAMSPIDRLRTVARLRRFGAPARVATWSDEEADVRVRFARLRTLYRARHAGR